MQAEFAAAREDARELLGRMAALAAVEADADEAVAVRQRLLERGERRVLAEVAQEAQDQRGARRPSSRWRDVGTRAVRPLITVANGTPRSVWVCGSKNISACTTLSAAARSK